MTDRIHQEIAVAAPPHRVYALLTDAAAFSSMTGGAPTEIDAADGGRFSCFGGMIFGRNLECAPSQRLVQAWRVKSWEPGTYSVVRFELREEDGGTRVVLDHTGFPPGQGEHLGAGWHANYWEPMKRALAKRALANG
jgi:activator of HSP90 ATPase